MGALKLQADEVQPANGEAGHGWLVIVRLT